MSNKLKNQTSPYLLQHSENPVNWYPWCEEAFIKAKTEDKPIFLSIGYSTCHWCHVMAHESFEDKKTAKILNENFISIKVDREERPDIDSVYMAVCQAFTGSGGWPTSIFMTPDQKPFFAGTYFPLQSRYGMPGFKDIIEVISGKWENNRNELLISAEEVIKRIQPEKTEPADIDIKLADKAADIFHRIYDSENGGFGPAPKFPAPHNLMFLCLYSQISGDKTAYNMVSHTLTQMRKGGLFDQIGYGFSRYSTDPSFLVPHFEKMLYDNALLIMAYASAYSISHNTIFIDTCEKTAEYILREMTNDAGGFYSAQDADSNGSEGLYYLFKYNEVINILESAAGEKFCLDYDITLNGNFEGSSIPNRLKSNNIDESKSDILKLYEYRSKRATLHLDDKILTSWNSLMISAFCMLYRISKNEKYLFAALKAQNFIESQLLKDNLLYVSTRMGTLSQKGFLDDYAFYISALIELYNSTLDRTFLEKAEYFCKETVSQFEDKENGGFLLTGKNNENLIIAPKETYDGAIPGGNSAMAYNFVRLYHITQKDEYEKNAKRQLEFMSAAASEYPAGHSLYLTALLMYKFPPQSITIVPDEEFNINKVKAGLPFLGDVRILESSNQDYKLINHKTTYYVCRGNACLPPSNSL